MKEKYEALPDANWEKTNSYSINAAHTLSVPGVNCARCGTWAVTGVQYPSFRAPQNLVTEIPKEPIDLERFNDIRQLLGPILGAEKPIYPGTELGAIKGSARGRCGSFAWLNRWTLLLREQVYRSLLQHGFELDGIEAELLFDPFSDEILIEVEILPSIKLSDDLQLSQCEICGRHTSLRKLDVLNYLSDLDITIPLQRVAEFPTIIIASAEFRNFIVCNGLSGICFDPLPTR